MTETMVTQLRRRVMAAAPTFPSVLEISRAEAFMLADEFAQMSPVSREEVFEGILSGGTRFMDIPLTVMPATETTAKGKRMTSNPSRAIFCCGCQRDVSARLTDGSETYPNRSDLKDLPFWKCDNCRNFVGCHHKTKDRTRPLGCIPTPEIKNARQHIHRILDPLWKNGKIARGKIYAEIAARIGLPEYHTAEVRSVEQARQVYRIVREIESRP